MSGLILPNATLGVVHRLGEIMTPDFKNGVCLFVRDNLVTFRIFKDGEKFYEVAFGEAQCGQMAEFFKRGADMIERQGGSGLPASRVAKAQAINSKRAAADPRTPEQRRPVRSCGQSRPSTSRPESYQQHPPSESSRFGGQLTMEPI